MTFETIKEELFRYIEEKYDLQGDPDYSMEVNLFDYGFIDSLGATEIICWLEENYNIEITQKDIVLYPMNSVEEIAEVVYGKVN